MRQKPDGPIRLPWPRVPRMPRSAASSSSGVLSSRTLRLRRAMYGPRRDRRRWWKLDEDEVEAMSDLDPWTMLSLQIEREVKVNRTVTGQFNELPKLKIIIPSKVKEHADNESSLETEESEDEEEHLVSKMLVQFDPDQTEEIFEFTSSATNSDANSLLD